MGSIILERVRECIDTGAIEDGEIYCETRTDKSNDNNSIRRGVCADADIVFLCVKPDHLESIDLSVFGSDALFVSILAGKTIDDLRKKVHEGYIVRIMPTILLRSTAWYTEDELPKGLFETVESIFCLKGGLIELESEDQFNVFTGVVGSGPAYVAYFLEAYMEGLLPLGISNQQHVSILEELVVGTIEQSRSQRTSFQKLRESVTSPGGTTQAGIAYLESEGWKALLQGAFDSAVARAKEL